MKITLSNQCESVSGPIARGTGYYLQARISKSGNLSVVGVRSRGNVPPDGHLRFIIACASIARRKTYFTDISLTRTELHYALLEAQKHNVIPFLKKDIYHADDIINLQISFGL